MWAASFYLKGTAVIQQSDSHWQASSILPLRLTHVRVRRQTVKILVSSGSTGCWCSDHSFISSLVEQFGLIGNGLKLMEELAESISRESLFEIEKSLRDNPLQMLNSSVRPCCFREFQIDFTHDVAGECQNNSSRRFPSRVDDVSVGIEQPEWCSGIDTPCAGLRRKWWGAVF